MKLKIWCEKCRGKGWNNVSEEDWIEEYAECEPCGNKGYTMREFVEVLTTPSYGQECKINFEFAPGDKVWVERKQ